MSKFVTLKTDKENRRGKSVILAGQECKFDEHLMFDAPERYVVDLVKAGLTIVDEEDIEKFKDEIGKTQPEGNQIPTVEYTDKINQLKADVGLLTAENEALKEEIKVLKAEPVKEEETVENTDAVEDVTEETDENSDNEELDLDKMGFEDLKKLCVDSKLPEDQWKEIKSKKGLRDYLKEKMKVE